MSFEHFILRLGDKPRTGDEAPSPVEKPLREHPGESPPKPDSDTTPGPEIDTGYNHDGDLIIFLSALFLMAGLAVLTLIVKKSGRARMA